MRFYSQNDLLNYWEGGKSYKQEVDGGSITVVSDTSRTLPFLTKKYFEVKANYDKGLGRGSLKLLMGAEKDGNVVLDAHYKIYYQGGRSEDQQGVFLHTFIDDCISLWEEPLGSEYKPTSEYRFMRERATNGTATPPDQNLSEDTASQF